MAVVYNMMLIVQYCGHFGI